MNLRQLEILKEVAATGSLTQAAYRLGISQPAVSAAISSLEEDVGFLLFNRTRSGTTLKPETVELAEEAERVLAAGRTWSTLAEDLKHGRAGKLQIGCLPGLSPVFMPRLIAQFLESDPTARIALQTHSSERIGLWVAAGHWDVGIMELTEPVPALRSEPFSIPMVCALPVDHRLADRDVIHVADLDDEQLITLGSNHQTTAKMREIFRREGVRMAVRVESHLFLPACMLVGQGVAIGIVDSVTALDYERNDVVFKPLRPNFAFDLAIVFPRYEAMSRQCRAFSDRLRSALDRLQEEFEDRGF